MNVYAPGLMWYVRKISGGEPFAFTRYGNGEWMAMLGQGFATPSRSQAFTPELREALRVSVSRAHGGNSFLAMQSLTYLNRLGLLRQAEAWLRSNAAATLAGWHDGEVFHRASYTASLRPLVEALRARRTVVVGPAWLKRLPFAAEHVVIQQRDCYAGIDGLVERLAGMEAGSVVSISAGPAAKVLVYRLWKATGGTCWLLDLGSLWDPYCGVLSRRYHRRITPRIIAVNMGAA